MQLNNRKNLLGIVALLGACAANAAAPAPVKQAASALFQTCAKPEWPADSLSRREEGTVTLGFLVGEDGAVIDAVVRKTSGYPGLDRAALSGIRRCEFKPTLFNDTPVSGWTEVQYFWTLADGGETNG